MHMRPLGQRDLLVRRSAAQLLDRKIDGGPEAGVGALLAVQAQDKSAWRLALRARVSGITAADVNAALTERRSLVVAWLNRGTLHLVRSDDYPWLWALTAPTQTTGNARRLAQEGLTPGEVDRAVAAIERWLAGDGPLTRTQLRERLVGLGIRTEGQALVHVLFAAVNRGVAVMGPMRGGEHAFAHTREWLGSAPVALKGEARVPALAELARRYLIGHGPATDGDLAKWSGLTLGDARSGLAAIASELVELEGRLLDLASRGPVFTMAGRSGSVVLPARLLPGFDPCLLGWREREPFLRREDEALAIPPGGGVFRPIATVNGQAAATWGLRREGTRLTVRIEPFAALGPEASEALALEAIDVARFEGRTLRGLVLGGAPQATPTP